MKSFAFVWRLTLTCGHLKLWGPFYDANYERYIGDHTTCDVCPLIRTGRGVLEQTQHLIVNVEGVDPNDCSPAWLEAGLSE